MMELFDRKFVHFMWDDELEGKRGFLSSGIDTLIKMVNEDSDRTEIQKGCERDLPFCKHITVECRLAYYDPNYEVKKAYYKEGKTVQVKKIDSFADWVDCHRPRWCKECLYRIKPDCPCEDGIDSKACAGCPQDEERKREIWFVCNTTMEIECVGKNGCAGYVNPLFVGDSKESCEHWIKTFGEKYAAYLKLDKKKRETKIKVQFRLGEKWRDWDSSNLYWNETYDYREKIDITYRPFKNCDELVEFWSKNYQTGFRPAHTMPLIWLRRKNEEQISFVTDFIEGRVRIEDAEYTMAALLDIWTFLDETPVGMEVKE